MQASVIILQISLFACTNKQNVIYKYPTIYNYPTMYTQTECDGQIPHVLQTNRM